MKWTCSRHFKKKNFLKEIEHEIDVIDCQADDGDARMRKGDELIAIPSQIDGLVAERVANYVILRAEGLGFTIRWDTKVSHRNDSNQSNIPP